MAVDLGQLDSFIDPYDVQFEYNGETYSHRFSTEAVLKFWVVEKSTKPEETPEHHVWSQAATLLGSRFDPEKMSFSGGFIGGLLKKNKDFPHTILDRVLTSVYLDVRWGDEVAKRYAETGSVKKALGLEQLEEALKNLNTDAGNNDENQNPETNPAPGETGGGDSEEK